MSKIDLSGRVAICTGSGRGMGRSHALLLASRGCSVVVNDLGVNALGQGADKSPAEEVVEEINKQSKGKAVADGNDVSSPEGAKALIETALKHFGRIDILVCNAGIVRTKPFAEATPYDFEQIWRINTLGTILVCHAAWPELVKNKYGRIICVSSSSGLHGMPTLTAYSSSKGGVHGFMRALATEGKEHGILVNAIAPNAFTRMMYDPVSPVSGDAELLETNRKLVPPELVSPAVVWLASEQMKHTAEVFENWGGKVSRVAIGTGRGYIDRNLSPESVAEHEAEIMSIAVEWHEAADSADDVYTWVAKPYWPKD